MIGEWLQCNMDKSSGLKFDVACITEKDGHNTSKVAQIFGGIFTYAVLEDNVSSLAHKLGRTAELKRHVTERVPVQPSMQKGKFGEMLEYRILEDLLEFHVLRKKWQLEQRDTSSPGADIVAVRMRKNSVEELTFVECKTTTVDINASLLVNAYEQLDKTRSTLPTILMYICGNPPDNIPASAIFEYATGKDPDSCRIALVCDAANWKGKLLASLNAVIADDMPRLTLDVVQIKSLGLIINTAYNKMDGGAND